MFINLFFVRGENMKHFCLLLLTLSTTGFVFSQTVRADLLAGNTPSNPFAASQYSNGCGGKVNGFISSVSNFLLDKQSFVDSYLNPAAPSFTVDFRPACDLHDAGYAGGIVKNAFKNNTVIDYRTWSRKQIDDQFLENLKAICVQQIPIKSYGTLEAGTEGVARKKCLGEAVTAFSATQYYDTVRKFGESYFDADPIKTGIQRTGTRKND
jgi:hypothetical protein